MNNMKILEKMSNGTFPFKIKITCTGTTFININEVKELQGGLKKRTEEDIMKILKSIREFGFSFPFFYWQKNKKKYIIDGHGRFQALKKLRELGGEIPELPACEIKAKDEEEAKQKLLRLNSQYGKIVLEGLQDFISDIDVNIGDLELPGIKEIDGHLEEFFYQRKHKPNMGYNKDIKLDLEKANAVKIAQRLLAANMTNKKKCIELSLIHI